MMITVARALAAYLAAWCVYVLASGEIFFNNLEATATIMAYAVMHVALACALAVRPRSADLSLFSSICVIIVISGCALGGWSMPTSHADRAEAHATLPHLFG